MAKRTVLCSAFHRNGISGDPFWVHLFVDEDGSRKVCIDFGDQVGQCPVAVLDVARLDANDIRFGSNSWRGDNYVADARKWQQAAEEWTNPTPAKE